MIKQVIKNVLLVFVVAISALGQSGTKTDEVTPVTGESWLNHLHRTFEETSMGKTGQLGPLTFTDAEQTAASKLRLAASSTKQTVTLHGADLYRLNCQGCHGESGLGAPPEINSVINPTRATSTQVILERMKKIGMDMSRKDAAELANQSKAALLLRLHKGGTDMPPFPHLSEPEVHAIFSYLKQLAEVPGAGQPASVEESRLKVGEHIVKSTCHICHTAAGLNPTPDELLNGAIPPLSTLTTRTSLTEFERKVRSGAPIMMGTPASLFRGRMPVFYYLRADEVADAYLYLRAYPPEWTTPVPVLQANELNQGAGRIVPVAFNTESTTVPPPSQARDLTMIIFQVSAELFVGLLLAGGFWFTLREIRRLTAISDRRKVLVMGAVSTARHALHPASSQSWSSRIPLSHSTADENPAAEGPNAGNDPRFHHDDHRVFESSWLARWIEGEDEAA